MPQWTTLGNRVQIEHFSDRSKFSKSTNMKRFTNFFGILINFAFVSRQKRLTMISAAGEWSVRIVERAAGSARTVHEG
jgi:hypothetical protein